jgi:hypothetical protein
MKLERLDHCAIEVANLARAERFHSADLKTSASAVYRR